MSICAIFEIISDSLYAIAYDENTDEDGNPIDCFRSVFSKWQDVEYLENFFEEHKNDLQSGFYGNISVEQAVLKTLNEASKFEAKLLRVAKSGKSNPEDGLEQNVFIDLHQDVLSHVHIESKAYGTQNKSWLRLYAIRISSNVYVVSGGAIKLTKEMNCRDHLCKELDKLKATAAHLKELELINEEDLGYIVFESYGEE